MLTETETAYLAGFFDGDGCVNIGTRQGKQSATVSHYLQVIFSQSDYNFLSRWRDKLNMGSLHELTAETNILRKQRHWVWRLADRQAETMLKMMLPYLDIKAAQAEIAIRFMKTKGKGGCRPTSRSILVLREQYRQMLADAKLEQADEPPEVQEYECLINSQLALFTMSDN